MMNALLGLSPSRDIACISIMTMAWFRGIWDLERKWTSRNADSSYFTAAWGHMHVSTCRRKNSLPHKSQPAEKGLGSLATPDLRLVKTDTYWLVWATEEFRAERKMSTHSTQQQCILICDTKFCTNSSLTDLFQPPESSCLREIERQWKEYIIPHWVSTWGVWFYNGTQTAKIYLGERKKKPTDLTKHRFPSTGTCAIKLPSQL